MRSTYKKYGKKRRTIRHKRSTRGTARGRKGVRATQKSRRVRMRGGRSYEPTIGTYEGIPYTKDTVVSGTYGIRNIKEQEKHDEYMEQQGSEQNGI